jgi:hypothetical protein
MVRDALALCGGRFGCSDIEAAIDLHRIDGDDFAAKGLREMKCERGFSTGCWAGDGDGRQTHGGEALAVAHPRPRLERIFKTHSPSAFGRICLMLCCTSVADLFKYAPSSIQHSRCPPCGCLASAKSTSQSEAKPFLKTRPSLHRDHFVGEEGFSAEG